MTALPLTPEARKRDHDIVGIDVRLLGETWTLACVGACIGSPEIASIQNAMYEEACLREQIGVPLLFKAFIVCLTANYDVTEGECAALFFSAPVDHRPMDPTETFMEFSIGQAVAYAVLPTHDSRDMEYSDWLESALLINGIDPEKIPHDKMASVLRHLVLTGRAVPPNDFVQAAIHGRELSAARNLARSAKA
jgi:hypothetical protein